MKADFDNLLVTPEIFDLMAALIEFCQNNIAEKGNEHVLDGAEDKVHEIAEKIRELPPTGFSDKMKEDYLRDDLTPELIYFDLLLKITNAPFKLLMHANIKALIPIIDDKLREAINQ